MFVLKAKIAGRSKAGQLRATVGRVMTELEMNSTNRGAVEIMNLCTNWHKRDVLNAECIRTFSSCDIDGRAWMNRLETSQNSSQMRDSSVTTYVPPTRKPSARTPNSKVNEFEAYGWRPLDSPWKLLSAYEFLKQWRCEPLLAPTHYSNRNQTLRTTWTEQGKRLIKSQKYRDGDIAAKPGEHYTAVEPESNEYILFPENTGNFRHSWALVRKNRPDVVVIEGLSQPSVTKASVYNSQYCSLFFRPWTLFSGDPIVPHLSLLGVESNILREYYESSAGPSQIHAPRRLPKKTARTTVQSMSDKVNWQNAWDEYVRGNVVSITAAQLIRSFLLNTMTSSGKAEDGAQSDADAAEDESELPPLKLPCQRFRELLCPADAGEGHGTKIKKRRGRTAGGWSTNTAIASENNSGRQNLLTRGRAIERTRATCSRIRTRTIWRR